jgi:ribose transport system substrate-binding protein
VNEKGDVRMFNEKRKSAAKKILTVLLSTTFVLAMVGCGAGGTATETKSTTTVAPKETTVTATAKPAGVKKKIGFSVYDMQYGFFQQMEKGTKSGVAGLGFDYVLHDQKSDETQMVSGAQDLINQGIGALIISPVKPEALGPIVEAAHAKKIPVVVDDIGGGGTNYDAIVISDNFGGGKIAAEYATKNLKDGSKEAAIIKVEPSAVYAIRRGEGFKAGITAAGFKVVKELSGHSKAEEGYQIMKDIITSNPKVQVVFAENDPMAAAAAQACVDAKRTDIMIIGFNGDDIALKAIKAGTMAATIQQVPNEMGKLTVKIADQLMKGEKVTFGDEKNREVYQPVNLITKENVDKAMADLK